MPNKLNAFRAQYQVVVVRTDPGPGPVHTLRKPAVVAIVIAEAPEYVQGVLTENLALSDGQSVDVVSIRQLNVASEKVYCGHAEKE